MLQAPRKWGGSGSEREEENLDFSAEADQAANGTSDLAADMTKVSLVDREDDSDTDSELEGEGLLSSNCLKQEFSPQAVLDLGQGACCHKQT